MEKCTSHENCQMSRRYFFITAIFLYQVVLMPLLVKNRFFLGFWQFANLVGPMKVAYEIKKVASVLPLSNGTPKLFGKLDYS